MLTAMVNLQNKIIHVIIALAIMCAAVLDFHIQVNTEVHQINASSNFDNTSDQRLSTPSQNQTSKLNKIDFDDPEEVKHFLLTQIIGPSFIFECCGSNLNLDSVAVAHSISSPSLARAPPSLI